MCAIAGELDFCSNLLECSHSYYQEMLSTMRRRGPDQSDLFLSENAVLLHARLSVIDLENGRQPMTERTENEDYAVVYNGELYNTDEVRAELLRLGWNFRSHSDTEVLLKAYIAWGKDCVNRFNGIFAFAVWESKQKRLFIARDKMGVKPFFYAEIGGRFLFASEIKTLLKHPLVQPEIDLHSISEIMLIGPGRTPGYGVFCNIQELPPACCGFVTANGKSIQKYWDLTDRQHTDSFEQTVEKVRFLVEDAIKRQLVSDVPIGTFLSGGLDSSIISSIAARSMAQQGRQLDTFSVYYKDNDKYFKTSKFQPNSDSQYIGIMEKYLNCRPHHVVIDSDELADALYEAVDARDLPGMADVDSSLLLFCKSIKEHCTVALSGECADEIFGGYPWYRDKTIRETEGFPWAQSTGWRAGFLKDEFATQIDAQNYVFDRYRMTADATDLSFTNLYEDRMGKIMINLNMNWFMQTLLDRKDRMSMYSGLEVRVPFCDYRIAEYLYSVPWDYKDYQNYEKGLLRKATEGLLPNEILWRKKSPYPKTHNPSYLNAVSKRLEEIIQNPSEPLFQFVKREKLIELLHSGNQTPWYGQLMTVPQTIAYFLQVNYWLKTYQIQIR